MEDTTSPPRALEEDRDSPQNQWSSPSRIHFPYNEATSGRPSRPRPESHKLPSGLTPPLRKGSPLNPQNIQGIDSRRKIWPQDSLTASDPSIRHRRPASSTQGSSTRVESESNTNISSNRGLESGMFSDEYDLSHEDPRILQDVQRALKMKARREARLKRETNAKADKPVLQVSSPSPHFTTPPKKQNPSTSFTPSSSFSPSSNRKVGAGTFAEVDFSPSAAIYDQVMQTHPIPSSIDNGMTLDWSTTTPEDGDRRWMGIGKKRDKDRLPPLGLMVAQQEKFYEARISSIKQIISAQTIRKADITSNQLARRYSLLYEAVEERQPLNLAAVSRWYNSHPESVRNLLEKTEPFTWIKHLEKRTQKMTRSPWHLTALIVEECVKSDGHHDYMQTIPEDTVILAPEIPRPRKSRSPSFLSTSRGLGIGSSMSMGTTTDEQISFEPSGETKRTSFDAGSRRSVDSGPNSTHSGSSNAAFLPLSPLSGRSADNKSGGPMVTRSRSPGSSSSESSEEIDHRSNDLLTIPLPIPEVSIHPPSAENTPLLDATSTDGPFPIIKSQESASFSNLKIPAAASSNPSLQPPPGRTSPSISRRYRNQAQKKTDREVFLRREYENKAVLLHEAVGHNNRIRQFLNRISAAMKDFDSIQNTAMRVQGFQTVDIPKELLEAFGHDPSAVTGPTRRDRGWRAVEDIARRVDRQRNVFMTFIQSFADNAESQGCSLDETLENLLVVLENLEKHRAEIAEEAETVSTLLESVQTVHKEVKDDYNLTVSHVSTVYPELSHIIALEESYKDQYQQVWELGMDALTLLLDTVTPFWRTYGKTIGEDVRDFLIIPLYRNEFTGEVKSYPLNTIPSRSHRHWLGLVLFFFLSIAINILQFRAAVSSSLHFRLHLIPYDGVRWTALPFFWVAIIIQWLAVITEFAIVFLQLGVIIWWIGWTVKVWS